MSAPLADLSTGTVRIVVARTAAEAARAAAVEVLGRLRSGRDLLGVATGSSPAPLYRELARAGGHGALRATTAFALDEYLGLPDDHPESYRNVVRREVVVPLGLCADRVHVPDSQAPDPDAAADAYERAIAAVGGVDVQILGIGRNGHIGFNEPGSAADSRTRAVTLSDRTRLDNSRFFGSVDAVPTRAITQGIATIMSAAHVVVVANGAGKADAVARALEGPIGPDTPASFLQGHRSAVFFLDQDAAGMLLATHR